MKQDNIFRVEYGSIYNTNSNTMIGNMGIIYDKEDGCLLKYGDINRGLEEYYLNMKDKYIKSGLKEIAEDIILIKFDRYESELSMDEICTFCNYLVMVSANKDVINNMLFNMSTEQLKDKLKNLKELGY